MNLLCLFFTLLFSFANSQNFPSVILQENNVDDSITQIFNTCKCVIFYKCDEENYIIPDDQLKHTRVTIKNSSLKNLFRIRCSNQFYYCCKNKTESFVRNTTTTTSTTEAQLYQSTSLVNENTLSCGQSDNLSYRVIDQFPWVVAIFKKKRTGYTFKCGGSLIHPKVVMTKLQCVYSLTSNEVRVLHGKEAFSFSSTLLFVSKIIRKEGYYSGAIYNDIALIILETAILNSKPACLPKINQNFNGQKCIAVQWSGTTNRERKLQKLELSIIESQRCQYRLRNTILGSEFRLHSSSLCAVGEKNKTSCKYSAGAPLMCPENGGYVQVGIASWGIECGKRDIPVVYTNVPNLVTWIETKLMQENIKISN